MNSPEMFFVTVLPSRTGWLLLETAGMPTRTALPQPLLDAAEGNTVV